MIRVLVVDDSDMVRELVVLLLTLDGGFHVREARDGVEALDVLDAHTVDVVVTDLRMPRMDGLDLAVEVRRRWPSLPILLLTAYAPDDPPHPCIAKPFTAEQLLAAVRDLTGDSRCPSR